MTPNKNEKNIAQKLDSQIMKTRNLFITLMLTVSAVLMTGGIIKKIMHGRNAVNKPKVIAVIPQGTIDMWWEVVHKGALKAADEEGVQIIWAGPETETDREKQIQVVQDVLIQKVAAVVLAPNDPKALIRSVEKIKQQGIPCVFIDSTADTDAYDAYAATDGYAGGCEAARILGKALGGRGKAIIIKYVQNAGSASLRGQGFSDTLKKEYPGIQVIAEQFTSGTIDAARQKTVDLLTRFPETDAIFAVNQPTSVGAYKAIQNQRQSHKIKFVGFDSDPVLLEGVKNGEIQALIAQNPLAIGYIGVKTAVRILRGEKVERNRHVPAIIVTQENLEEMKLKYAEALGL